jgi:hypothetical protein
MSKHDRKEPPLLRLVNHIARHKTSISYYVSMAFLISVFAMTFAGVTL